MLKKMKAHEEMIKAAIIASAEGTNWEALKETHRRKIGFMQHERLIHLLVTLAFAVMVFISLSIAYSRPSLEILVVIGLLLVLLVPYIFHYYTLENMVQRWYKLYDELEKKT